MKVNNFFAQFTPRHFFGYLRKHAFFINQETHFEILICFLRNELQRITIKGVTMCSVLFFTMCCYYDVLFFAMYCSLRCVDLCCSLCCVVRCSLQIIKGNIAIHTSQMLDQATVLFFTMCSSLRIITGNDAIHTSCMLDQAPVLFFTNN